MPRSTTADARGGDDKPLGSLRHRRPKFPPAAEDAVDRDELEVRGTLHRQRHAPEQGQGGAPRLEEQATGPQDVSRPRATASLTAPTARRRAGSRRRPGQNRGHRAGRSVPPRGAFEGFRRPPRRLEEAGVSRTRIDGRPFARTARTHAAVATAQGSQARRNRTSPVATSPSP